MAYDIIEVSEQDGSPRLLFVFTFGNAVWRFTNNVMPIIYDGNTYNPAQIEPSAVVMASEIARDNITLSMPITQQPGPTVLSDFENVLTVTILRGHLGDPDGQFISFWKGRAVNFQIDRHTLKIHCEPVFSSLRRPGLNAKYQRSCRWPLYGRGCWVDMEDFAFYTVVSGSVPPLPIIPPPNALIYVVGNQGVEVYNADVSPFAPVDLLTFPDPVALSIGYSLVDNSLFIASETQIHRWRTNRTPYQPLAPIAANAMPQVMEVSPNGRFLFYGAEMTGNNYLLDLDNDQTVILNVDRPKEAKFSPTSRWLVYSYEGDGGASGFRVFDLDSWPPTPVTGFTAQTGSLFTNIAIRLGNILATGINSFNHTYFYSLETKALLRIFSTSIVMRDFIFTPDGSKFIALTSSGIRVWDSSAPDPNAWTLELPVNVGLPINNTPENRKVLSVSADSRYLALYQTTVAGDRRIVIDLTLSPIQRIASFDAGPADAPFRATQFIGSFV